MKIKKKFIGPRKLGRPRSFDKKKALHQAMLAYWRHGYDSTSIAELTQVMRMSPPSVYSTFGNKKHLFLQAMHHYVGSLEKN